jgi:tetratricopeptide (TPR) repeat protein
MRRIQFEDQTLEMSERDFLILLRNVADGVYVHIKLSYSRQINGFPSVSGLNSLIQKKLDQQQTLIAQIEDEELRELFLKLDLQVRKFGELDHQIIAIIAKFLNQPAPQTQRESRKFLRNINKASSKRGPIWAIQPEYQQLTEQSKQAFAETDEVKAQIDDRLTHLISTIPDETSDAQTDDIAQATTSMPTHQKRLIRPRGWDPQTEKPQQITAQFDKDQQPKKEADIPVELGDQRAHDLIDEADEEFDTQRAIRLLRGALRFGHTGIQASKAYAALAMRYEDLGDKAKAIEYYTKALEAWHPSAIDLFWRGELYYQLGQWDNARSDFEKALAFSAEDSLVSPEREQAKGYLVELDESKKTD